MKEHAVAKLLPKMSARDFDELKTDIQRRGGILEPIWIQDGKILDGRHRWRACKELGLPCPTREYMGDDLLAFALSANVVRRHLSANKKRGIIAAVLKTDPARSDRQVGVMVGVAPNTVGAVRKQLEATAQIEQLGRRDGADGKSRPVSTAQPTRQFPVAALANEHDMKAKKLIEDIYDVKLHRLTDPRLFAQKLSEAAAVISQQLENSNAVAA